MKKLLLWGAGDQGLVTLDCALAMQAYSRIDFLELKEKGRRDIPGYTIFQEDEGIDRLLQSYDEILVATGSNDLREARIEKLNAMGLHLATIVHPTAVISPLASVAAGSTVLASAVINANARVGMGCIVNTQAVVEHDCVIEDFVNICPRVAMAGHTTVGRKVFLGIGCTIIDGIQIGKEAVVGAGAVVIRNVPAGAVVVGVPAKKVQS